jgi:RNA methyltransferase, TrmH family
MISKNKLKYYSSLVRKKERDIHKKFIVEGLKTIEEGLDSQYSCEEVFITVEYEANNKGFPRKYYVPIETVNEKDFNLLTDTVTPQGIAAVFNYPPAKDVNNIKSGLIVCLENIADPGNLGTIIRNCDWFGVTDIVLSKNCADHFSPKTVRSSMGSIFHLNIYDETELGEFLENYKKKSYRVLCADTEGEDLYSFSPEGNYIVILASEAHGPSVDVMRLSDHRVTIPRYGKGESLNVASASAVILSHLAKKL